MSDKKQKKNQKKKQFQLEEQEPKVRSDLHIDGELRSHSDGSGPSPIERPRPAQMPEHQLKKRHKKRSRKKGHRNAWLFRGVWLCVIVLVGIGIAEFCVTSLNDMLGFQKTAATVTIELKKNATTEEIAQILKKNGLINNPWAFSMYSKLTKSDGNYEYGAFELTVGMDYQALINNLQASTSRVDTVKLTFTEGMQVTQMADMLEDGGICTAEEFIEVVNDKTLFQNYECVSDIPKDEERTYFLEGYLFPDTYEFYKNEGAENVVEKMLNNTSNKLTTKLYKKASKIGMSMDEVLTLASMIQKEAADKVDMYNISSIFHNRLDAGLGSEFAYLNSDPTMWYPYLKQKDAPEGYDSAYNTYTHVGLPLGPICNPGMSAIEAALEPADTDYYYFCHSKEGQAYYAATEWEHQQNLATAGLTE